MVIIEIILSIIAVLLLPGLTLLWRGAVKWTRVEVKLDTVTDKLQEIVRDKDKVHQEMLVQMREDRTATNSRLRWLEENLWKRNNTSS